jgi:hypothetical protein
MEVPAIVKRWSSEESPGAYAFDLSTIPQIDAEDLLSAFRGWGVDAIAALDLNCHAQSKLFASYPASEDSIRYPPEILQSIGAGPSASRAILDLLRSVLPGSRALASLTLDWLDLELPDVHELIGLIPQAAHLRTLRLNRPLLTDDDLRLLLATARPDQLQHVRICDCYVSEASVGAVLAYVAAGSVRSFVIETDGFGPENQQTVDDAVDARIEAVRCENRELRASIQCLRDYVSTKLGEDRTVAVGPGAERFNQYLEELVQSVVDGQVE